MRNKVSVLLLAVALVVVARAGWTQSSSKQEKQEKQDCNRLPLDRGASAHAIPLPAIVPAAITLVPDLSSPAWSRVSAFEILADWLVFKDKPDHMRMRMLVQKAFSAKAVASLHRRVEEICDTLLAQLPDEGEVNLLRDFCIPLSATVISDAGRAS